MFSVIISEKGGAERRESFDRTEINVGRVQGNDLMLPKGNVSKRHARLLYRDGRFIVTDLNSTNGTYVNRRRISQATIVREGDRIYIGDFVLRIELSEGASDGAISNTGSGPVPSAKDAPNSSQVDPSQPEIAASGISEDSGASYPKVPGPPRVPFARPPLESIPHDSDSGARALEPSRPSAAELGVSVADDRIGQEAAAHRVALAALVERVLKAFDPVMLSGELDAALAQSIERAIGEQSAALQADGELPPTISKEMLSRDARAELTAFGPLSEMLDD